MNATTILSEILKLEDDKFVYEVLRDKIQSAFEKIPKTEKEERNKYIGKYLEQFPYKELSDLTGVSERNICIVAQELGVVKPKRSTRNTEAAKVNKYSTLLKHLEQSGLVEDAKILNTKYAPNEELDLIDIEEDIINE